MKIDINIDATAADLHICVTCKHLTPDIEKILAALRMLDKQLTARKGGETYLLDLASVIYIESVDRKCFIYTDHDVYESDFKLYELEQRLEDCGFFRVNKSCLIHLKAIRSLKADLNRRVKITLNNGEQIIASRQYADELKIKLGVK